MVLGMGENEEARERRRNGSHADFHSGAHLHGHTAPSLLARLDALKASEEDSAVRLCQVKRPARSLAALGCYLLYSDHAPSFPAEALPKEPMLTETQFSVDIGEIGAATSPSTNSSGSSSSVGKGSTKQISKKSKSSAPQLEVGSREEKGETKQQPASLQEAHARAIQLWQRERVGLFDLPSGLLVLERALVSLASLSLVDPEAGEELLEQVKAMRRDAHAVPALFPAAGTVPSSLLKQTRGLEARLRDICVRTLASVASFAPRTLVLRNQRTLLATAFQICFAVLGAHLHCTRHGVDCLKELDEDRPCVKVEGGDLEEIGAALVRMICTGATDFVPASTRSKHSSSSSLSHTDKGASSKSRKRATIVESDLVEPAAPPLFVHGVLDLVMSVPATPLPVDGSQSCSARQAEAIALV